VMITKVVKSIIYNIKIKYALKWEAVLARLQVQFWLHRYRPNSNCRFLARDSIYAIARYMASPVRPSVCLSVTRVDQSKMVEVSITQPSPQSSPCL